MSDKEPRRRKKRKDSQPPRKEDVHTPDDHFFMPSKSEAKDSDQETEEEIVIPTHQPSVFAKFVFVLLFSGLVVSLSFIFISLHGTDRGDVDIFNGHSEEIEVPHDEHDFHDHDAHDHDDHDHDAHDHDDHDQDDHDHDEEGPEESFQESLADYFPSIGSILSFTDEYLKEPTEKPISDNVGEGQLSEEQLSELPVPSPTDEYVTSKTQDSIENDSEDTEERTETPVSSEMFPDILEEPESVSFRSDISHNEVPSEQDSKISPEHEADVDEQDDDEISENVVEYSDPSTFTTEAEPPESFTESYTSPIIEDVLPTTPATEEKKKQLFDQDDTDFDDFIETSSQNTMEEEVMYYEKESMTNDEDFKIREQLDDLDEILQKEFSVNNNDEDDDDDDDDDQDDDEYDDDDEGTRDEFDFWQF